MGVIALSHFRTAVGASHDLGRGEQVRIHEYSKSRIAICLNNLDPSHGRHAYH